MTTAKTIVTATEGPGNASSDIRAQFVVALAGAIGVTAGAALWIVVFSERGTAAWSFAYAPSCLFLAGAITFAWARGVPHLPQRVWRFGWIAGALLSIVIDLAFWLLSEYPFDDRIVMHSLRWGLAGFLGGLAIEKGWCRHSAMQVAVGVGIASVITILFEILFASSFDRSNLSDLGFWRDESTRQLLPAIGWALGLLLLRKSEHVLHGPHEGRAAVRRNDTDETTQATSAPFRDQRETAIGATIGASAGIIVWYAIFESRMLGWDPPTLAFLLSVAFSIWLNRYLNPSFGHEPEKNAPGTDSRQRLRGLTLLGVAAAIPVTIFTELNDDLLSDQPMTIVLWLVMALGSGSITLAWARGACRSPARAIEFGALASLVIVGF